MRTSVISLGLAASIGIVIGLLLQSPDTELPAENSVSDTSPKNAKKPLPSEQSTNKKINMISQQLAQEISARKKLQRNVEILGQKLAELDTQKQALAKKSKATSENIAAASAIENRAWFNEQALIDSGLDANTAQNLKSRYEKQELDKLYLRDQAMREGWFGSRRYREELEKLDAQLGGLQKELGDESFSAYLFATGQSNRVTVQSVLAKSSADTAGIRANDQILRYGSQRIYNWRDLRNATTQGDINETITVEIIRDGEPMEVYVQRGPMGIRMSSVSLAP